MTKNSQEVRNGKPSRLVTGLLAASMLFGLNSISGCTSQGRQFSRDMGYNVVGTFLSESVRKEMGHSDYQQQQREENRTYVPEELRPAQLERAFFACNYYKDFNNNGITNYPEEYVGIKNKFRNYETIVLVSHDGVGDKGTKIVQKIFNPKGEEIYNVEKIYPQKRCSVIMGINGDAMEWLIKKGGYGNFKSVWYINNAYADSTEFEIVHSEQTKKPDKEILEKKDKNSEKERLETIEL